MTEARSYCFKLVLLGDSSVGKSSIVLRFVKGQFYEYMESTIGAAFLTREVETGGDIVKFEIWDTAGQERYHSLAPMYYRGASAAIVVYDIQSSSTFERAKRWINELQKFASNVNMVIALVGNKFDMAESREVSTIEAQNYAEEIGVLFMETSAKTAHNVEELFIQIARELPRGTPGNTSTSEASNVFLEKDQYSNESRRYDSQDCKC